MLYLLALSRGVTQFALISRCPIVSEWSCGKGIEQAVLHRLRLIKFQIASIPLLGGKK